MFYYIKGALALLKPALCVIDVAGVGYKLTISDHTYEAISGKSEAKLFTHLAVREDGIEMFGFHTEAELDTFQLLTSVSGVGPKAAMAILSKFTPDQFMLAVCTEDKKSIAKANGIGPKIAARIILELHDKLVAASPFPELPGTEESTASSATVGAGTALRDAQEALLVLGYTRTQVLTALQGMETGDMTSEAIIRAALKKLMR